MEKQTMHWWISAVPSLNIDSGNNSSGVKGHGSATIRSTQSHWSSVTGPHSPVHNHWSSVFQTIGGGDGCPVWQFLSTAGRVSYCGQRRSASMVLLRRPSSNIEHHFLTRGRPLSCCFPHQYGEKLAAARTEWWPGDLSSDYVGHVNEMVGGGPITQHGGDGVCEGFHHHVG